MSDGRERGEIGTTSCHGTGTETWQGRKSRPVEFVENRPKCGYTDRHGAGMRFQEPGRGNLRRDLSGLCALDTAAGNHSLWLLVRFRKLRLASKP